MLKKNFTKLAIASLSLFLSSVIHTTNIKKPYESNSKYADCAVYKPTRLEKPVTLDEIFHIAYKNRDDLVAFNYVINANWYAERAALGGFLPQFSIIADSGASSRSGISGIGQLPIESISFNMSQLIFSYDGPLFQYKVAQEETHISKTQKEQLENGIRFNAEQAFLESKKIVLKNKLIGSVDISSNMTFAQNISKEKVGFLNRTQWKGAQTVYSKDQADVENYPDDVKEKISILQREVNAPVNANLISHEYEDIDDIKLLDMRVYCKLALENRPDIEQKIHQIKQAEYSNKLYKYRYVPEIYLAAQVTKSRMMQCPPEIRPTIAQTEFMGQQISMEIPSSISFENTPLSWHVGLQATWNFDGLSSFNTSKRFDNLSTAFMLQKKDLELDVVKNVEVTYNVLTSLINLLQPAKKQYETAKTQLDNLKTQYETGLAALFSYKEAERNYKQAKFDLISLKIDIRANYQRLLFLCGYSKELDTI